MGTSPVRARTRACCAVLLCLAALAVAARAYAAAGRYERDAGAVTSRFELVSPAADSPDAARRAPTIPFPTLMGGEGRHVFWARLTLTSRADAPTALYVVPERGWDRVSLVDGPTRAETGVRVPLVERAVPRGHALLPVTLAPREARTVLLRFEGVLDGWEPPHDFLEAVSEREHAELARQHARLVLGAYAGLLLALTFVNLLFGFALRDPVYTDYVLYAVPYGSIWLARDYIGAEAFWPGAPYLDDAVLFVTICLSIVFGNRFAMRFLGTKSALPRLHRLLALVNVLVVGVVVLAAFSAFRFVPSLLGLAALATSVLYIVAGVILAQEGARHARIFAVATGVVALGTIVYTLADFDLVRTSPLTHHSAQLGSAIGMLLLAFALADRIRQSEQERRAAEEMLRTGLEREVSARTEELERINDKLIELNQQLEAQSLTDALTGIANRRRFEAALEDEWRRALREGTPLSLLLVDVDHFKPFNDEHGHPAGDECLRRVARVLTAGSRRAGDLLARYGGEEFVLILPNTTSEAARTHAEQLRAAVADVSMREGAPLHVTVSIGAATVDGKDASGDAKTRLVQPADEALYAAKERGRNRVVVAAA